MPIKTVKFNLQAQPAADQDVNVLITVDNVTVFNQSVPTVGPVVWGEADPSESFSLDLDVAASGNVGSTETRSFSISATNGTAKIENIMCNFVAVAEQVGNIWNFVPGNADDFVICNIVSQPAWNGEALLSRYNIEYNNGPINVSGPGEVLILEDETVIFDVAVYAFNDTAPDAAPGT